MRRTSALTKRCQQLFEDEYRRDDGWQPIGTIRRIAGATDLTFDQVRDAIFGVTADTWRRAFIKELMEEKRNASS